MADRYFNRDRYRPYDEDYDEDYYDQDFGNRGSYNYGYNSNFGMRNRGDYGWDRNYGRYGAMNRDYNYNNDNRGTGWNSGYYGSPSSRGYDYDYDYDYGRDFSRYYGRDFDRWNRGDYSRYWQNRGYGNNYGNMGRGYSGGYGYDRSQDRNLDRRYGRNNWQNQDRTGYGTNQGYTGYGYNRDFNTDFDYNFNRDYDYNFNRDYDYDEDFEPSTWTYQEVWYVPGPFSGIGPQGYQRSDDRIREDINERLTQHGRLNASNIQVQVNNGEVTLSGTVDKRQDKRTAEDIADTVSGVRDVHNQVKVQERQKNQGKEPMQGQQTRERQRQRTT